MSSRRLRAILLDIDGTLLYSNDQHAQAFVLAAEEMGITPPPFEELRRLIGMGGDKLIPQAFGFSAESEQGKELDERKGRLFRERLASSLQPTPGARDLLERFKAEGLRLVAATSAGEDDLELLLKKADVRGLIDEFTTASDVEESKPAPDIIQSALKLAGASAGECVMVGDTPYDVEAALAAGVGIVAVRSGGWSTEELAGALAVYDHPAAILADYSTGPFR